MTYLEDYYKSSITTKVKIVKKRTRPSDHHSNNHAKFEENLSKQGRVNERHIFMG